MSGRAEEIANGCFTKGDVMDGSGSFSQSGNDHGILPPSVAGVVPVTADPTGYTNSVDLPMSHSLLLYFLHSPPHCSPDVIAGPEEFPRVSFHQSSVQTLGSWS
uniref:Uncharacterized protein n=1 Tax=Amphimedon queenslandica TaxID=400682 RepID=A0A1X7URS7_AMPQE